MARALSAEQHWAVLKAYGSLDNAIDEALRRSPELQELWQHQHTGGWSPSLWEVFWGRALPLLGINAATAETAVKAKKKDTPGRRDAPVSETEANKAARIHIKNSELTAYAVWTRYNPRRVKQKDNPKLLSKNMIGHLLTAMDRGWLPWDAAEGRLVISGEFRAGRGRFVIPRRKPAS